MQGLHVGQGLARMLFVRQRIDDRQPRRGLDEVEQAVLPEGADDDRIHPALEVARHVDERLTVGVHHIGGNLDELGTELAHANREGDARPQRGLLEEQPEMASGECRGRGRLRAERALGLHAPGQGQRVVQFARGEVEDGEEVAWHAGAPTYGTRR